MDTLRQWAVAVSAVVGVAVAFLASGAVVGTPVNQVADGALATDATLVAPAGPAFSIWGVIYTGLLLLAALQLTPSRRTDPRQRRVGWLVAASLLLNAAWVAVIQAEWLALSVAVIALLLAVLVVVLVRLGESPPSTRYEAVVVDGTLGLYLGWVCIATVANTAATLVASGVDAEGSAATAWAVAVLGVAAGVGVLLAVGLNGRLAPGDRAGVGPRLGRGGAHIRRAGVDGCRHRRRDRGGGHPGERPGGAGAQPRLTRGSGRRARRAGPSASR